MNSNRRPFVAGNWKLHLTVAQSVKLVRQLKSALAGAHDTQVGVAPVATSLQSVAEALEGSGIAVIAQNMHWEDRGAFTGELSAPLLKDVGVTHVILGHSERRHVFGESDADIQKKVAGAGPWSGADPLRG